MAPLWARWEGSPYLHQYRELLDSQYLPVEKLRELQWSKMKPLLEHAYEKSPFYRRRFTQAGVVPGEMLGVHDLSRLPVLTKKDLRESFAEIACAREGTPGIWTKTTSGSTGTNVKVLVDDASGQFKRACTLRSDEWSGWRLGEKVAASWGNPEYKKSFRGRVRNGLLERRKYLDTLNMDEIEMEMYARELLRWKPSMLFGHAHSVYLFSLVVRRSGIKGIRPKGIITTAMVLHEQERAVIEDVFQCKVTNRYGCEEVSLIGCECEQHDGLHINAESIYVETLRDGQPAMPGQEGSIVVTDLTNHAMPMIRYAVGDVGTLSDRQCGCGRTLPMIERLEGRVADYVYTPDGRLISGISLTENFAGLVRGIGQLQIVQDQRDHITLRIVKGPEFDEDSVQQAANLVRTRFGDSMRHSVEYVPSIAQEPSGKYRFCISKVRNPLEIGVD